MSDKKKRPLYAWDTSVFLAHLKGEMDKPLADIAAVFQEVETDKADMIVSITTYIELLDIVDSPKIASAFTRFTQLKNVIFADVSPPVADVALQVRYSANKDTPKRNIKIGDAQIIATAIAFGADVLHTFDPKLLNVSKSKIVQGLVIVHPKLLSGQRVMTFTDWNALGGPPRHFQRDGRHPLYGPARSVIELACQPRSLALAHR